jgi:hypothetical protein
MLMRTQPSVLWLTGVNLLLTVVTLTRIIPPVVAEGVTPVLRARSLEIVDEQGRVRASLSVLAAGTSAHGDRYPETVLLRLITERGRPSVKISASEEASGVSLAGPSNTKGTYVILEAKGTASSLTLRNEDGRQQVVQAEHDVERQRPNP